MAHRFSPADRRFGPVSCKFPPVTHGFSHAGHGFSSVTRCFNTADRSDIPVNRNLHCADRRYPIPSVEASPADGEKNLMDKI